MCFKDIEFLFGSEESIRRMPELKPLECFDERTLDFLSELSEAINNSSDRNSELRGFSFWLRRASLEEMKRKHGKSGRHGRGLSFHIAPSNMPLVFAFSMSAALLTGNAVIVKVSNRENPFISTVISALERASALNEFKDRIAIIRYSNQDSITSLLSKMSDTRVIWGSDETVEKISAIPLKEGGENILFKNRYSLSIIGSREFTDCAYRDSLMKSFYSDTYRYDQNACSSPRLVVFRGDREESLKAENLFFEELGRIVKENNYDTGSDMIMKKLVNAYALAAEYEKTLMDLSDRMMMKVRVKNADCGIWDYTHPAGLFVCWHIKDVKELENVLTESIQTLTVFKIAESEKQELLKDKRIKRVVPFGSAVKFDLVWDGINLTGALTSSV